MLKVRIYFLKDTVYKAKLFVFPFSVQKFSLSGIILVFTGDLCDLSVFLSFYANPKFDNISWRICASQK